MGASAPPRRSFPSGLVVLALAAIGLLVAVGWVRDLVPSFDNPFREQTVERTGPALLRSIRDLQEYRAASGNFQVIVDVERDTSYVPDEIKGERVLFLAVGSVDAGVDFGTLGSEAVEVSDDRRSVAIVLPAPELYEPVLDLGRSRVYRHERGLIDRIGDLLGGPGSQRQVYRLAEQHLAAAARDRSGLVARARANTRTMLVSLLRSLGFERVQVRFEPTGA